MKIDGFNLHINFIDTGGQEIFRAICRSFYNEANGIILVYDVSQRQSFDKLEYWLKDIIQKANENVVILLIGNKIDLEGQRQVSR